MRPHLGLGGAVEEGKRRLLALGRQHEDERQVVQLHRRQMGGQRVAILFDLHAQAEAQMQAQGLRGVVRG